MYCQYFICVKFHVICLSLQNFFEINFVMLKKFYYVFQKWISRAFINTLVDPFSYCRDIGVNAGTLSASIAPGNHSDQGCFPRYIADEWSATVALASVISSARSAQNRSIKFSIQRSFLECFLILQLGLIPGYFAAYDSNS